MRYISPLDLAKIVNAMDAEQNPLVRASLESNYVDALNAYKYRNHENIMSEHILPIHQ